MSRSPAAALRRPDTHDEVDLPGVDLGRVHRHGLARRAAVWAALAAGPLGLFASCASAAVPARTPVHAAPAAAAAQPSVDPAGFAQLFLSLWLRTNAGADDAHSGVLRAMAPNIALLSDAQSAQGARTVAQCAAVRSTLVRTGFWSVLVGCEIDGSGSVAVRYFTVPVQTGGGQAGGLGSLMVVAQPAEVAAPAGGSVPQFGYPVDAASGSALASSAAAFVQAYLTGQGDVASLLTPGAQIAGPASALYARVAVSQIGVDRPGMDGPVPGDGTTAELWVQVSATDQAGASWPLSYALRMRARAGRWEVAALEPGPLLTGTAASPTPAVSASAGSF